jgi:hypothetical protein
MYTCTFGAYLCDHGHHCDAQREAPGPSSLVRFDLRWAEDYDLLILGALAFAVACVGRMAHRKRWGNWVRLHIIGMGMSYVLLLTAFYVDNGKSLPLSRNLPSTTYWLLPSAIGIPLIVRALLWHPLVQAPQWPPRP